MSTEDHGTPSLLERILAYLTVGLIVVALGSFFATLIVGLNDREAATQGFAQVAYAISLFALPAGFVLLIVMLVLGQSRRKREAKAQVGDARKPASKKRGDRPGKR